MHRTVLAPLSARCKTADTQSPDRSCAITIETRRAQRGHTFYPTAEELATIPPLYETENVSLEDTVIHLHYFTGSSDWWIAELDPATGLAFGYARLNSDDVNAEWGYIDLTELEAVYGTVQVASTGGQTSIAVPLLVERDLQWIPRPFREVLTHA